MIEEKDAITPIYSPYNAEVLDPQFVAQNTAREDRPEARNNYRTLPWSLEDLSGTTWCNVYTGEHKHIVQIIINRQNKKIPVAEEDRAERSFYTPIGFWAENRFYIEDWVRVDHLPPSVQLAWLLVEIDYLNQRINSSDMQFDSDQEEQAVAIQRARALARENNLPMPQTLLGVHIFRKMPDLAGNKDGFDREKCVPLTITDINRYSIRELNAIISTAEEGIRLEVPCPSIGSTQEQMDIADDWLTALFIGETIAEFCEMIVSEQYWSKDSAQPVSVRFFFRPKDVGKLAERLLELSAEFNGDEEEGSLPLLESLSDFRDGLEQKDLHFPELADNYLANYVVSSHNHLDDEDEEEYYSKYPEHKYLFWRSFASKDVGFDFYVSDRSWILPLDADVEVPLVKYGNFEDGVPDLYESTPLLLGNFSPIVFNQTVAVKYPLSAITIAQKCAEDVFSAKTATDSGENLFMGDDLWPRRQFLHVYLSADGQLMIASDRIAQYIFFFEQLPYIPPSILKTIIDHLQVLSSLPRKSEEE